ncbi:MAG: M48 family metallopeptidase [Bacteroidota bacterium]
MQLRLFYLFILSSLFACNLIDGDGGGDKPAKTITYSYTCLDSAVGGSKLNKTLGKAGNIVRDLAVSESSITDEVQSEWGASFHKDAIESKTFNLMNDAAVQSQLEVAMKELLAARQEPSKINYAIYALEDTAVNAFTFGGRIYVTRAMLQKTANNKDLLYAIVGHEIGHSEKGHIKKTIQDMQLSTKIFGEDGGTTFFQIKKLLTGSFNQKNELEADYYGTDLTYNLNQNVCAAVAFWKEMASRENSYSKVEDFFRSHPFSSLRAECLEAHIKTNFSKNCGSIIKEETTLPQLKK